MKGETMQLGMVGLGRMGAGIVRRLLRAGDHCVGYDLSADAVAALADDGAGGRVLPRGTRRQARQAQHQLMVPAGEITDQTIAAVSEALEAGDVIDGGNSHYHDDIRHAAELRAKGTTSTSTSARAAASGGSSAASA